MDRKEIAVAKQFVKKVAKDYKISKSLLFGSRARGDSFVNSDYDVIIVSKDFEGVFFPKRMAEMYLYWDEDVDLEPLCYTPEEFEAKAKYPGIVQKAIEEGIWLT